VAYCLVYGIHSRRKKSLSLCSRDIPFEEDVFVISTTGYVMVAGTTASLYSKLNTMDIEDPDFNFPICETCKTMYLLDVAARV
jgi:hypothetical protein